MSDTKENNEANLRTAYQDVCSSYHAIDNFRAKLLGFLPLASGTGIFLVLDKDFDKQFLTPIRFFGFLVTLGYSFTSFVEYNTATHSYHSDDCWKIGWRLMEDLKGVHRKLFPAQ